MLGELRSPIWNVLSLTSLHKELDLSPVARRLTGASKKSFDLLILWHVLDGHSNLLSDTADLALPFQATMPPVY